MIAPTKKPVVVTDSMDGNAYIIMAFVSKALKREGADKEYVDQYIKEAKSGDYDNLLAVSMEYADFI